MVLPLTCRNGKLSFPEFHSGEEDARTKLEGERQRQMAEDDRWGRILEAGLHELYELCERAYAHARGRIFEAVGMLGAEAGEP